MPVIYFPVERIRIITSPSLVCQGQVQLFFTLAVVLVGPITLLALAISFSRKYKTSRHPTSTKTSIETTLGERPCVPRQSHEYRIRNINNMSSLNGRSQASPFMALKGVDEDSLVDGRELLRTPSDGQERHEEPSALRSESDNLRDIGTPPPMPLTPPVPSTAYFQLQDRRLSVAASTNGEFDPTLRYGANSDLTSSDSATVIIPNVKASSPIPLRKSYTNIFPIDPSQSSSSTELETDDSYSTFAPSSFPASSPIFPLAPHAALEPRDMDLTGEIVSALDNSGASWKRHTRVYGGGVCLACLASGGGDHGGYYGENVPLDQRR